jgi:hypothetical protein
MANPSDIIIPGAGAIPVDPSDPTKGVMTPVWKNEQITGAILELREVVGQIGIGQQAMGQSVFAALNEIGELIECLAVVAIGGSEQLPKDIAVHDEATDKLAEFVTARRELREQMEAEQPEAPDVPERVNPELEGDGA